MRLTALPAPLQLPAEPSRHVADSPSGWPCRRCLQDAQAGEVVLLVSYDPWLVDSPYRQAGPVFVHERDCAGWAGAGMPQQQTSRLLSVRVIDHEGRQVAGDVVPGRQVQARLEQAFADPATAFVHLHNAGPGCFAARVDRD